MSFGQCSCPDCGTILRIRDKSFIGREVPCPECRITLRIELDHQEQLTASRLVPSVVTNSSVAPAQKRPEKTGSSARPTNRPGEPRRPKGSPLMMAWALALAATALVIVALLRPTNRFSSTGSGAPPAADPNTAPPGVSVAPSTPPKMTDPVDAGTLSSTVTETPLVVDALTPANLAEPLPFRVASQSDGTDHPQPKPDGSVAPKPIAPPQPVKIDFEPLLKQRLLSFDQTKPASRRELIELVEELLGAAIHYDEAELGDKHLDKLVSFKLENTTVKGVLGAVLDPAGWDLIVEDTRLRIRLKPTTDPNPRQP